MNKRLLLLNLHFSPFSFGGATIVAEETALRLKKEHGWDVLVVTSIQDYSSPDYSLRRYKAKGMDVVSVVRNHGSDLEGTYNNRQFEEVVLNIARQFKPDVCHLHAIQDLGVNWIAGLKALGSKVVATLHDCWWLCERQFMINSNGYYCDQKSVSLDQCRYCTNDFQALTKRNAFIRKAAESVDLLLYPSEFHKELHVASGFDESKSKVNKNGVNRPGVRYAGLRTEAHKKRKNTIFGFTGGPGNIKGALQIVSAFGMVEITNYRLKIVDSAQNIGASWEHSLDWKGLRKAEFVPAYSQDTMDEFFSGIDVLLFPSQWKESFGLTVREALARDVWVISTDCGAPVEDIVDGENGTVIPFDFSYRHLATAIEDMIDRDWASYTNPYKDRIRCFQQQTNELNAFLDALN